MNLSIKLEALGFQGHDLMIPAVVASQVSVVRRKPMGDFVFGLTSDPLDGLRHDGEAGAGDKHG